MAIRVYIDAGHGGKDVGAVKHIVERDANLVMALAAREYLEAHGVIVMMSRTDNNTQKSIATMVAEAEKFCADYVISVHNNAGGGDGFEVFCSIHGGKGKTLAKNIEAEVKKIGQNSRGVKIKKNASGQDYYGMIRLTSMPAIICEGVFVDNATDVKIADTAVEQRNFGYAYAKGLLKTVGIKDNGFNKVAGTPAASKKAVDEDGVWGMDTTKATQKMFGITQDGIISNQLTSCKEYLPGCLVSSWQFKKYALGGSATVKKIQKLVKVKADGYMGYKTVCALQEFLGVTVDGYMGAKTVKAWQKYVNKQLA